MSKRACHAQRMKIENRLVWLGDRPASKTVQFSNVVGVGIFRALLINILHYLRQLFSSKNKLRFAGIKSLC
jgi:hypothetical protein